MTQTRPEKLSRREREIMNVLFSAGGGMAVEDVRSRLTDPPTYSAVRAMLAKLEAKGHIRHREEGLRYVYEPTTHENGGAQVGARTDGRRVFRRLADRNRLRPPETHLMDQR